MLVFIFRLRQDRNDKSLYLRSGGMKFVEPNAKMKL